MGRGRERDAESPRARVRREAVGRRLTGEGALSVLQVAVVRSAGHVVLALKGQRARGGHLPRAGRRRRRRAGGYAGLPVGGIPLGGALSWFFGAHAPAKTKMDARAAQVESVRMKSLLG